MKRACVFCGGLTRRAVCCRRCTRRGVQVVTGSLRWWGYLWGRNYGVRPFRRVRA